MSTPTRQENRRQLAVDAERFGDHGSYFGMMRRCIAALGRRIAKSDPDQLVLLAEAQRMLDDATAEAVAGLRDAGFSWEQIGAGLGITRQAAFKRWGQL